MPDESLTPNPGTSEHTEGAPVANGQGFDFERAYNELRPEFTQRSQRLSEYESVFAALHDPDPAVQAQAMQYLGLEYAEGDGASSGRQKEEPDEWADPLEAEVRDLRAWREQVQEERELEAAAREEQEVRDLRDQFIGESITDLEQQLSQGGQRFEFSEREERVLGNLAIAMAVPDERTGALIPDVQGAYDELYGSEGVVEHRFQQRIETKKGAFQAPLGTTIPADRRPKTAEERINWIDQRVADLNNQQ